MTPHLRFFALIALLLPGLVSSGAAQESTDWATVTGQVLDSEGRPLVGARISIFPMDVSMSGGIMPREPITDGNGRYRLVSPAYHGRTRLCAVKESAGYPDTQGLVFHSETSVMPILSLVPGGHLENVDIHLGPPDGTLEGSVIDAATRKPISKARIILSRHDRESNYSTSLPPDGHFLFALPPAPIEIVVQAPGYALWKYKDSQSGAENLVLPSSDHRLITVELENRESKAPQN